MSTYSDQRSFDKLPAVIIGLATILWGLIDIGLWGQYDSWPLFMMIALHLLSAFTAAVIYFMCRIRQMPTNVALIIVLLGVVFFFVDVALTFEYSAFFGLALILVAVRRRDPLMAFGGALSLAAALIARFAHELDGPLVLAAGVAVLGMTALPSPSKK